jgi:hypothetical protein
MPTSETVDNHHQQLKDDPCHLSKIKPKHCFIREQHHSDSSRSLSKRVILTSSNTPALVLKHTLTPLAPPGANPNRLSAPNLCSLRVSLLLQNNTCLPTTTYYYYANYYIPHDLPLRLPFAQSDCDKRCTRRASQSGDGGVYFAAEARLRVSCVLSDAFAGYAW